MRVRTEKLTTEGIKRTKRTIKTNYQKNKKPKNKKILKYQNFAQKRDKDKKQTTWYRNKDKSRLTKQIIRSENHHSLTDNKGIPL